MAKDRPELHGTVVHQLPANINLRKIQAHVSLQSGLDKAWGETYLLVHENELVVLTRTSVFDEYERARLPPRHMPRLEEGGSLNKLVITTLDGEKRVNLSRTELPETKKLLAALSKIYG